MTETYTILETAKLNGLSEHTLRYYEKIGLICNIKRDAAGRRQYSEADMEWIDFIVCMRTSGLSLEQMHELADLRRRGPSTLVERITFMKNYRQSLVDRVATLNRIIERTDHKIALLEQEQVNYLASIK